MSYTDYKKRWIFKNGDAYYIPQSKSYKEILKGGLSISELTYKELMEENYLLEENTPVKELEQPPTTQVRRMLPSEETLDITLDIESPMPRRKGKKVPKLQSNRNRKKPHQRWTRLRYQYESNNYDWFEINPSNLKDHEFYYETWCGEWYMWNDIYGCFMLYHLMLDDLMLNYV
jgi:hypothetical protein